MKDMFWLFLSIVLGAFGQLFLKIASMQENRAGALFGFYMSLAVNYHAWAGALCYGFSFLIWFRVLTRFDLSFARPFVSVGYVVTAILSVLFLQEKVTPLRWAGIAFVTLGSILLGLSKDL